MYSQVVPALHDLSSPQQGSPASPQCSQVPKDPSPPQYPLGPHGSPPTQQASPRSPQVVTQPAVLHNPPPEHVDPAQQGSPSPPHDEHEPFSQIASLGQTFPQLPQFAGSFSSVGSVVVVASVSTTPSQSSSRVLPQSSGWPTPTSLRESSQSVPPHTRGGCPSPSPSSSWWKQVRVTESQASSTVHGSSSAQSALEPHGAPVTQPFAGWQELPAGQSAGTTLCTQAPVPEHVSFVQDTSSLHSSSAVQPSGLVPPSPEPSEELAQPTCAMNSTRAAEQTQPFTRALSGPPAWPRLGWMTMTHRPPKLVCSRRRCTSAFSTVNSSGVM